MILSTAAIIEKASAAMLGKPLIENTLRAVVVEAIVSSVLPSEWTWCAAGWWGWDFVHKDGTRLEVKQSAARQSWPSLPKRPYKPRFDIALRKERWEGATRITPEKPCRFAHIYLFAYHAITNDDADHRDPRQWTFYLVQTQNLPITKQISLLNVAHLSTPVGVDELATSIEVARFAIQAR
jgi:hypothetical protein